jgi:hypothetical protein
MTILWGSIILSVIPDYPANQLHKLTPGKNYYRLIYNKVTRHHGNNLYLYNTFYIFIIL